MPEPTRVFHHDLCFGCGQANLFGLQLELEPGAAGGVEGRFFVKQDHQGPPGFAHGGVLTAALDEAMALVLHGQGTSPDRGWRSTCWRRRRSGRSCRARARWTSRERKLG